MYTMASSYVRSGQQVRLPSMTAANQTLYSADSGKTILIPPATAAGTLLLPPLEAGLYFKLIMQGTAAAIITVQTPSSIIIGNLLNCPTATTLSQVTKGVGNFTFTATAVAGDWVELTCDGSNYYVYGISRVAAGLA